MFADAFKSSKCNYSLHDGQGTLCGRCHPITQLILQRASASRPSGQWKDEDYDVLADGKVVGRILEEGSRFGPPELRWGGPLPSFTPKSGYQPMGHPLQGGGGGGILSISA